MKRVVLGVCLLLASSGMTFAQDSEPATAMLQGDREIVELVLKDIEARFWSEISDGSLLVSDASERCNGGSCLPPGGPALSCPTSGGPICGKTETCQCTCTSAGPSNAWKTKNECVAKATTPATPANN